jgi:tRNA-specific 2-thiouridylase
MKQTDSPHKVAIGMSGGVDSSVAAALLLEAGHEVVGVTLALWRGSLCCSFEDVTRAKEVCRGLGIRHMLIEALDDFRTKIVEPFIFERLQGRTPNPCVLCNQHFKFGLLWEQVQQRDAAVAALASGHYARLNQNPETGRWEVFQSADPGKDQSYMLWRLSQTQLAHSRFPLGHLTKPEVRAEAMRLGLTELAQKPDSQDLCFIVPTAEQFWRETVSEGCEPGEIVNTEGQVVGQHSGRVFYTPGQRRGLGVGSSERMYVSGVDPVSNRVQIARKEDLMTRSLTLREVNWVSIEAPREPLFAGFKTSSRSRPAPGVLELLPEGGARIELDEAQMPVGQGQSIVFYDDQGRVLGGGVLASMP